MALEPGVTYIEDLVATNPTATDNVDEGDDHIRNIKIAIQGSFPSLGAAAVTKTAAEINDLVEQTNPVLNGTITGTAFLDEDTLSSDSAIAVASQQSIKAYVDAKTSLNITTIEIGTWNMDTNGFVDVAHGVTFAKIRTITALIRNDVDTTYYTLDSDNGGHSRADATNVRLTRLASGQFDSTGFDTMGDDGNRGWITIGYTD